MALPKVKLGEIWIARMPPQVEGREGHEQTGPHPCIIVAMHEQSNLCTVIPLTSTDEAGDFPFTVQIARSVRNGLTLNSVAMAFQNTCIDMDKLDPRLGTLEPDLYQQVCSNLKRYLRI